MDTPTNSVVSSRRSGSPRTVDWNVEGTQAALNQKGKRTRPLFLSGDEGGVLFDGFGEVVPPGVVEAESPQVSIPFRPPPRINVEAIQRESRSVPRVRVSWSGDDVGLRASSLIEAIERAQSKDRSVTRSPQSTVDFSNTPRLYIQRATLSTAMFIPPSPPTTPSPTFIEPILRDAPTSPVTFLNPSLCSAAVVASVLFDHIAVNLLRTYFIHWVASTHCNHITRAILHNSVTPFANAVCLQHLQRRYHAWVVFVKTRRVIATATKTLRKITTELVNVIEGRRVVQTLRPWFMLWVGWVRVGRRALRGVARVMEKSAGIGVVRRYYTKLMQHKGVVSCCSSSSSSTSSSTCVTLGDDDDDDDDDEHNNNRVPPTPATLVTYFTRRMVFATSYQKLYNFHLKKTREKRLAHTLLRTTMLRHLSEKFSTLRGYMTAHRLAVALHNDRLAADSTISHMRVNIAIKSHREASLGIVGRYYAKWRGLAIHTATITKISHWRTSTASKGHREASLGIVGRYYVKWRGWQTGKQTAKLLYASTTRRTLHTYFYKLMNFVWKSVAAIKRATYHLRVTRGLHSIVCRRLTAVYWSKLKGFTFLRRSRKMMPPMVKCLTASSHRQLLGTYYGKFLRRRTITTTPQPKQHSTKKITFLLSSAATRFLLSIYYAKLKRFTSNATHNTILTKCLTTSAHRRLFTSYYGKWKKFFARVTTRTTGRHIAKCLRSMAGRRLLTIYYKRLKDKTMLAANSIRRNIHGRHAMKSLQTGSRYKLLRQYYAKWAGYTVGMCKKRQVVGILSKSSRTVILSRYFRKLSKASVGGRAGRRVATVAENTSKHTILSMRYATWGRWVHRVKHNKLTMKILSHSNRGTVVGNAWRALQHNVYVKKTRRRQECAAVGLLAVTDVHCMVRRRYFDLFQFMLKGKNRRFKEKVSEGWWVGKTTLVHVSRRFDCLAANAIFKKKQREVEVGTASTRNHATSTAFRKWTNRMVQTNERRRSALLLHNYNVRRLAISYYVTWKRFMVKTHERRRSATLLHNYNAKKLVKSYYDTWKRLKTIADRRKHTRNHVVKLGDDITFETTRHAFAQWLKWYKIIRRYYRSRNVARCLAHGNTLKFVMRYYKKLSVCSSRTILRVVWNRLMCYALRKKATAFTKVRTERYFLTLKGILGGSRGVLRGRAFRKWTEFTKGVKRRRAVVSKLWGRTERFMLKYCWDNLVGFAAKKRRRNRRENLTKKVRSRACAALIAATHRYSLRAAYRSLLLNVYFLKKLRSLSPPTRVLQQYFATLRRNATASLLSRKIAALKTTLLSTTAYYKTRVQQEKTSASRAAHSAAAFLESRHCQNLLGIYLSKLTRYTTQGRVRRALDGLSAITYNGRN